MSSTVKNSNLSPADKEPQPHANEKTIDKQLTEILDNASLKDMLLKERRKEAKKPLFLTRYE